MQTNKYDIICGEGKHRSYTAAIAEIILLNKYGNQNDYFWRLPKYYNEYVNLIKLSGKLSKEVGKEKGSWKGGCVGCSYEILPNETPLECLKRMEKERKF